jgi:hypothetical protein
VTLVLARVASACSNASTGHFCEDSVLYECPLDVASGACTEQTALDVRIFGFADFVDSGVAEITSFCFDKPTFVSSKGHLQLTSTFASTVGGMIIGHSDNTYNGTVISDWSMAFHLRTGGAKPGAGGFRLEYGEVQGNSLESDTLPKLLRLPGNRFTPGEWVTKLLHLGEAHEQFYGKDDYDVAVMNSVDPKNHYQAGETLIDTSVSPPDAGKVWTEIENKDGTFGSEKNGVYYYKDYFGLAVYSPRNQSYQMLYVFDDYIRVWANGTEVIKCDHSIKSGCDLNTELASAELFMPQGRSSPRNLFPGFRRHFLTTSSIL